MCGENSEMWSWKDPSAKLTLTLTSSKNLGKRLSASISLSIKWTQEHFPLDSFENKRDSTCKVSDLEEAWARWCFFFHFLSPLIHLS